MGTPDNITTTRRCSTRQGCATLVWPAQCIARMARGFRSRSRPDIIPAAAMRRITGRARHSSAQSLAILPRRAASTVAHPDDMEAAVASRQSSALDFVQRGTLARGRPEIPFLVHSTRMRRPGVWRARSAQIVQHTQSIQTRRVGRAGAAVKSEKLGKERSSGGERKKNILRF